MTCRPLLLAAPLLLAGTVACGPSYCVPDETRSATECIDRWSCDDGITYEVRCDGLDPDARHCVCVRDGVVERDAPSRAWCSQSSPDLAERILEAERVCRWSLPHNF